MLYGKLTLLATLISSLHRSTDGGLTFSAPPENLSENTGSSTEPQISVEGNNVYVVWEDDTPGN